MDQTETRSLLQARRELTGGTFVDETIAVWHEALSARTYDECRRALIHVAREERKITVAHIMRRLVETSPPEIEQRKVELCIRCRMIEPMPLRTRCEMCQAAIEDEIARGLHSKAMTEAIANARRLGGRT